MKYFVLESCIFFVKTSPSIENPDLENKMQLRTTNFQGRKFSTYDFRTFRSAIKIHIFWI